MKITFYLIKHTNIPKNGCNYMLHEFVGVGWRGLASGA